MLVLGHAGIALGAATLLSQFMPEPDPVASSPDRHERHRSAAALTAWFGRLGRRADIRLVLLGSLLPDIIDKPLGQVILRESISNGRIFAHSLLFFLLVTVAGLYVRRRNGSTGLLALSFGMLVHIASDQMWLMPVTLFWPLLGPFGKQILADWASNIWYALLHDPAVYVPEIVGGLVLVAFVWTLLHGSVVRSFLRSGRLDAAGRSPP
jgi:membrane-bound metal-dependent hydrolase YbcI (DUF457 family)